MKRHETTLTTSDRLQLYCQGWYPSGEIHAVIVLVHGMGEHSDRYAHMASYLVEQGFAMLSFDLRGHGKSQGARGHLPEFRFYLEDLDLVFDEARKVFPGKPLFLYGHSLGSLIVLYYVLDRQPDLAGCIATGVALHTALREQTLKVAFAQIAGSVAPAVSLPSGLDPGMLCRDPEVVRGYVEDPLVHDRATLGFAKHNIRAIDWILEHAGEFQTPLLIMHGSSDELNYPSGGQEFASKVPGDSTVKLWPDMYHEIHNEPEKEQVFAYLSDWLMRKTRSIDE